MSFEFANPWLLGLWVLLPPWLWLNLKRSAQGIAGGWILHHPLLSTDTALVSRNKHSPVLLQALALALLILALAQPRQVGSWITPPPEGRDLALVIDTSLTMGLEDFELNGKAISRMTVVKQVLTDFVAARNADRFALLVYGSDAALLTPPTFDQRHVMAQLQRLQIGVAGENTALGDALGMAIKPLRQQTLRPAIILVSDAEPSNSGELSPMEAVAVAHQLGIAIHTLEVGSANPSPPPAAVNTLGTSTASTAWQPGLADIARLTGGQHWKIRSTTDALAVMRDIDRLEPTLARPASHREVSEWYLLPLCLGMASLALAQLLLLRRQVA